MTDPLLNLVAGALRSAVHDHGPITLDNITSAAKRMVGQLRGYESTVAPEGHWRRRYDQLRHGHRVLVERHDRIRTRLDAVRTLHAHFGDECVHCKNPWPCPTILAIDRAVTSPPRAKVGPC